MINDLMANCGHNYGEDNNNYQNLPNGNEATKIAINKDYEIGAECVSNERDGKEMDGENG